MKNVVFFIGSLQLGGTEAKLARNILPFLKKRGKVNPKLLLLQERGDFLDVVPDSIERLSLDESIHTDLFRIIPRFRDALVKLKADIVISCMWYPAIISYLARKFGLARFEHIVHDTVNMTEYIKDHFAREKYRWLKICLTKRSYCDADVVIVVSHGEKKDLIQNFKIPEKKIIVVYNPVDRLRITDLSAEDAGIHFEIPVVVSVGRLVHQKGFDILLRAFGKVRDVMAAKLLILGDGGKRGELISLTQSLDLEDDVLFPGMQVNPFQYMRKAEVFCLASRYEGLGNVILEAMALGLPVVVTDCPSGPAEIVENGKYGILVPTENADALAEALIRVLADKKLRAGLSELSLKRAKDFDLETSMKQWEDVILGV
ncbi:MAG TPA: glycosyltransferase [Thermodesulfovibrionales bacterium]|nr:glycosyltransferase [Thermodesulfovibrionales bacterium]